LDTDICSSRSLVLTDFVVSVHKDTRVGAVIADSKVVRLISATTTKAVLISHGGGCSLVEDTLVEIVLHLDQVIKEGGCGVQGDVRVRKARSIVIASGATDQSKKLKSKGQQVSKHGISKSTYAIGGWESLG
jgi:hypothetical protein